MILETDYDIEVVALRDYFAGCAVSGLIARGFAARTSYHQCALEAYDVADAMVRQRAAVLAALANIKREG